MGKWSDKGKVLMLGIHTVSRAFYMGRDWAMSRSRIRVESERRELLVASML